MKIKILLGLLALDMNFIVSAQTGWLDSTFNSTGIAITADTISTYKKVLAVQSDDKIVVAATSDVNYLPKLVRYNTDGSLDLTFGVAGVAAVPLPSSAFVEDITLQSDGKIIIIANSYLVRLNADGTIDPTFNSGYLYFPDHSLLDVAMQSNGNIVVAMHFTDMMMNDFAMRVAIIDPNGVQLSMETVPHYTWAAYHPRLAIQADDKAIISWGENGQMDQFVFRVNANGTVDLGYATSGLLNYANDNSFFYDTAIASNGDLFSVGKLVGGSGDLRFTRIDSNGVLASNFGVNGILDVSLPGLEESMVLLANGSVLMPSTTSTYDFITNSYLNDYVITRLTSALELDTTFSSDGQIIIDVQGANDFAGELGVTSNGQIVVTGGVDANFGTIRLKDQCTPKFVYDAHTICSGDTIVWIDGNSYTASNNSATFTVAEGASNGCDSIITLNLNVIAPIASTDVQSACNNYSWIDGITYTTSNNTAMFVMTSAAGCDSLITLDLNITTTPVANATDNGDGTLSSSGTGNYQWIDCDNNNATIPGATAASFAPTVDGNYAVIVDNGNCSDTSTCVTIDYLGLEDHLEATWNVYPNPTNDAVYVTFEGSAANCNVYNSLGQVLFSSELQSGDSIDLGDYTNGMYIIELTINETVLRKQLMKK